MPPQCLPYALLLIALLAISVGVRAEGEADLKFTASTGLQYDSNLFRLSSNANALALIGQFSPAERISTTTLGIHYNRSYSLQHVELDASVVKYQYQNFGYLDFSAFNYNAAWNWSYTPHLYGNFTSSRNQTLNSFADFQGFNQRNVRLDSNTRLNATYELGANWRVLGALSRYAQSNSQPLIEESDFRQSSVEAGLGYVLPSGSSLSYTFRSTEGEYRKRAIPSPGLSDNGYTQTENELRAIWAISANTSADIRTAYRSRKHPNYPQRDFSGLTGGANINWTISAKSLLVGTWTHELDAYETANSNFSHINRFSLGPVLQISPKASVRARVGTVTRDYRGSPSAVPESRQQDTIRTASISVDWKPVNYLELNASLQNSRRSANVPGLDFNSNMITVTAQLTY